MRLEQGNAQSLECRTTTTTMSICIREVLWVPVSLLISWQGEELVQILGNESQPLGHITEVRWLS
jgi:hypothetical protein